jgi:IS5 family transposase
MADSNIIPFQPLLAQALPTISGNLDYRQFRDQLLRLDLLLQHSGLEARFLELDLQRQQLQGRKLSPKAQQNRQLHAVRALRCILARLILQEDYRAFAAHLADSALLQFFCRISRVDLVSIPAKSSLQRYDWWWSQKDVRQLVGELLALGAAVPAQLLLPEAVDLESVFLDTTCVAAPIHYPVDWVLLRDATRTLTKAIVLIRDQGLKHRMPAPETFLSGINKLCIAMAHAGRRKDVRQARQARKKTLRQMDRLVGQLRGHAGRYRDLLDKQWEQTQWTRPQADQVLRRLDQVLKQLPQARKQARQRILQEQPVPNEEKILSLYEPDVRVIVRRKPGAEVEFGNTLLLGENPQGLIVDWEYFRESAPADAQLLPRSLGRLEAVFGSRVKAAAADRGFDSELNRQGLESDGIYNAVCPRDPRQLAQKSDSWKFKKLQRRRAQTEGRIAILKNAFLEPAMRLKGFARRELLVTWTVLTHNLWVIVRWQAEAAEEARQKAA